MGYPLPEQQHACAQKYAAFTILHLDATRLVCGTVNNVDSKEMLYCSSSSEHFDARAEALRGCNEPVQGSSRRQLANAFPIFRFFHFRPSMPKHPKPSAIISAATLVAVLAFTGCTASQYRAGGDVVGAAGGGLLANKLSHGNPWITTTGTGGSALLS